MKAEQRYKIKQRFEDFIVKEVLGKDFSDEGRYAIFMLKKKNLNTMDALRIISDKCNISSKDIGFCGNKDKRGITFQHISVQKRFKERLDNFGDDRIGLDFLGFLDERLNLGDHTSNCFEITVRNLQNNDEKIIKHFPNYFGEQRFSTDNAKVGKFLIKKDYENAAKAIAESNKEVKEYLLANKNDHIGAINMLKPKTVTLYVHAYQALLFNRLLCRKIEARCKDNVLVEEDFGKLAFPKKEAPKEVLNLKIPLVGFDSENEEALNILKEEGITPRELINRQIPSLTCEESFRDAFSVILSLKIDEPQADELNIGLKKRKVCFELSKGCYATIALRSIFLAHD